MRVGTPRRGTRGILCMCEAARVPVIWATQAPENLAKMGAPSRAAITDAAMGERPECVILNKGPPSGSCPSAGRHRLPNAGAPKQEERRNTPVALVCRGRARNFRPVNAKGGCRLNKNSIGIPGNGGTPAEITPCLSDSAGSG